MLATVSTPPTIAHILGQKPQSDSLELAFMGVHVRCEEMGESLPPLVVHDHHRADLKVEEDAWYAGDAVCRLGQVVSTRALVIVQIPLVLRH